MLIDEDYPNWDKCEILVEGQWINAKSISAECRNFFLLITVS
jgi:hypothetical protein